MIFAGVSSLQNMFEAVAESLLHQFPKLSRTAVLIIIGVLCLGCGIGMETISKWGPWMDIVSIYIIPIGATIGAVSWFYIMKRMTCSKLSTAAAKRIVAHSGIPSDVTSMYHLPLYYVQLRCLNIYRFKTKSAIYQNIADFILYLYF